MAMSGVRSVRPDEIDEAAQLLSDAFGGSEFYRTYMCKGDNLSDEELEKLHVLHFRYVLWSHMMYGLALVPGEDLNAIALWLPDGRHLDDWSAMLRSGLWRLFFKFKKYGRRNFFSGFLPSLRANKARLMGSRDRKSWYLTFLATKPGERGKGYGSMLLQHVINMVRLRLIRRRHTQLIRMYLPAGNCLVK